MDLKERILRYMASVPPAIQGQNGSGQTYYVACQLVNGFALSRDDALFLLREYNSRCQPPWSEKELEHKVDDAINKANHQKPRGHLIGDSGSFYADDLKPNKSFMDSVSKPAPAKPVGLGLDPSTAIEVYLRGRRFSEADVTDASPVKMTENFSEDAALLVQNLYLPGEKVNFVTQFKMHKDQHGVEKPVPHGYGESVERNDLIGRILLGSMPESPCGGWMRMNPVDGKGVSDKNITAFRFVLLEFDAIPLDLQISLLATLPLPIAAILTSGARSIHAWVKVDCMDATAYKDQVTMLLKMLVHFGLDPKNKNPSRLSRLVGAHRVIGASGDGRQRLLYLNPNPEQRRIIP